MREERKGEREGEKEGERKGEREGEGGKERCTVPGSASSSASFALIILSRSSFSRANRPS